ncbi:MULTISPECIES: YczE/YyaS/YitT family protein [Bacillus]|uniref:Permease n=2 Tax=Bacillus TaxID=1386 RepID=A0A0M4FXA8_9BACI|nr:MULTISPECIES: permease [Bacillus]ALC83555.1 permease [Bacillus gobiensis]MBP1082542.1 putative membrane protein YczE [Bacillus capparidis]MED1097227.1 permease [Bacillus capparidis]
MDILKRAVLYLGGLFVLAFGVVLMIKADVGTAPWDALYVGLAENVGLTAGSWIFIVLGILIVINSIIRKALPNVGGFIPIILLGFYVDLLNLNLLSFIELESLPLRWGLYLAGIVILALGISIYLQARFAPLPNDELMLALSKRFGWKMSTTKTVGEGTAFILAIIFRGPIGIGSIVSVLLLGFLVGMFNNLIESAKSKNSSTSVSKQNQAVS